MYRIVVSIFECPPAFERVALLLSREKVLFLGVPLMSELPCIKEQLSSGESSSAGVKDRYSNLVPRRGQAISFHAISFH